MVVRTKSRNYTELVNTILRKGEKKMNKKFRMAAVLLVVILITSALAACSSNNGNSKNGNNGGGRVAEENNAGQGGDGSSEVDLEPYDLTLALPIFGAIPRDMKEVQDEINKITQAEINTTVTILPISIGAWGQQLNLMTTGGEKLDLYFIFGQAYSQTASNGSVKELDELLEKYGQGIIEELGAVSIQAASVKGKTYGVPVNGAYSEQPGIMMRKDLVEKYNIDISSIKSIEDLDSVFQTIKDNEPGIVPMAAGISSPITYFRWYDRLGDSIGVLPGFDNDYKVENLYETEEYIKILNVMREWYQKGYINKDAATTQDDPVNLVNAGKAFAAMAKLECGVDCGIPANFQQEMVVASLSPESYTTTNNILTGLYGIAQQSQNPERAMMMLNLMYTNSELANLMTWGIEGKHYVKVSETQVEFPEGVDASNVGYMVQSWLVGNPLITYVPRSNVPDYWDRVRESNEKAIKSKALGFAFDASPVQNEMTAINNVVEQYQKVLETGTVDPSSRLEEFNKKLKSAGIDKYLEEKQRQLDEWLASN